MVPALIDQLKAAQFTFVVGKGGTGKSTTAAALALAIADSGQDTLLLSTDPAHSIADVFRCSAGTAGVVPSSCSKLLLLEELNAEAIAGGWLDRTRVPLEELIAQGTYLDAADISGLTHLTLPGLDEIAAALRIAELCGTATHVVVDTAPTGHTLRLLDTALLIDSWVAAFRAMADKTSAVALHMVGARIRSEGEDIIDELEAVAARFRLALAEALFVIVTRNDSVVEAETSRLVRHLERRSLRVAALIAMDGASGIAAGSAMLASFTVPRLPDARGCGGLRRWAEALHGAHDSATGVRGAAAADGVRVEQRKAGPPHIAADTGLVRALHAHARHLTWFAGKGGVGKSTCAAAVAVALSAERDVLLCSTDPAGSLVDLFGSDMTSNDCFITPRLHVRQVDAAAELEAWRRAHREEAGRLLDAVGLGGDAALDRAVMRAAFDMVPPGIDELLSLAAIVDAAQSEQLILVDTAPTGHFLRLLEAPGVALGWTHALLRIILDYGVAGKLDGFSERVLSFARQLKHLSALLTDPDQCGVFVVSLEEPVIEAETDRLIESLRASHVPVAARIANRAGTRVRGPDVQLRAPVTEPPPRGVRALAEFVAGWEVIHE